MVILSFPKSSGKGEKGLASFAEFFGGLFIACGLFIRPSCILVIITMFVACHMHFLKGQSFEMALLYGLGALSIFLTSNDKFSINYKRVKKQ